MRKTSGFPAAYLNCKTHTLFASNGNRTRFKAFVKSKYLYGKLFFQKLYLHSGSRKLVQQTAIRFHFAYYNYFIYTHIPDRSGTVGTRRIR